MWCPNCRSEMAAELSTDGRRLLCTSCRAQVGTALPAAPPKPTEQTREARALLQRWSNSSLLDPFGPVSAAKPGPDGATPAPQPKPTEPVSRSAAEQKPAPQAEPSGSSTLRRIESTARQFRFDAAHELQTAPPAAEEALEPKREEQPAQALPEEIQRLHEPHQQLARPHFNSPAAPQEARSRGTNWTALAGQLLAYIGVGGLTCGAAFVIWGYFGGPAHYAPLGWLVLTAGQMMLFLGVITLVSGGMEQTTDEVARRIDTLGEKILRIEQATLQHSLSGPHFAASEPESESARPRKAARASVHGVPNTQATHLRP